MTYRGGAASRQRTFDLVSGMLHTTSLNPMAHLICVAHTRLELADILVSLRKAGVENLMALGGDPPADPEAGPGELAYAIELVELARAIGGFSVGVAAHPAGHPRSTSTGSDRDFLAAKLEMADFGVTQFFFEASEYEGLRRATSTARGIRTPVLPGILPVTSLGTMGRLGAMGAAAPEWMQARLRAAHEAGGADAVRREGVQLATELCADLLELGVPGTALLHLQHLERDPGDLRRARIGAGAGRGRLSAGRRAADWDPISPPPSIERGPNAALRKESRHARKASRPRHRHRRRRPDRLLAPLPHRVGAAARAPTSRSSCASSRSSPRSACSTAWSWRSTTAPSPW